MRVYETVTTDREISIHALRVEGDVLHFDKKRLNYIFLSTPSGWRATAITSTIGFAARFLSTPSGWRATGNIDYTNPVVHISIHALRVEGDRPAVGVRRDRLISIHALRVEGDKDKNPEAEGRVEFLSTPSGWRATDDRKNGRCVFCISIHALRVEGDKRCDGRLVRPKSISIHALRVEGDRAHTAIRSRPPISIHALRVEGDYAAYLYRRRREISIHALRVEGDVSQAQYDALQRISIHALRVEGDSTLFAMFSLSMIFLSTPSGWRATRVQGDHVLVVDVFLSTPSGWRATRSPGLATRSSSYFYPRPPGGGRRWQRRPAGSGSRISIHALRVEGDLTRQDTKGGEIIFLSTPSGWRATMGACYITDLTAISIHALRVEGDLYCSVNSVFHVLFLSTPSGWRATAKTDKVFICFCAKGRRICLFKTRKEKNLPVAF